MQRSHGFGIQVAQFRHFECGLDSGKNQPSISFSSNGNVSNKEVNLKTSDYLSISSIVHSPKQKGKHFICPCGKRQLDRLKKDVENSQICNLCYKKAKNSQFYTGNGKRQKFDCSSCLRQQDKVRSIDNALSMQCNKYLKLFPVKEAHPGKSC